MKTLSLQIEQEKLASMKKQDEDKDKRLKKKKKAAEKKGSGLEAQEGTAQSAYLMFWGFYVNLFLIEG